MEDLILYSHTYDEHIQLLRLVFRTADERNVSFNRKKTTFAVTLLCLRVMWFQNMDFAQIPTLPAPSENSPSNITDLRSFFGLCQQVGNFSPKIASTLAPLSPLLKKAIEWEWTPDHDAAFIAARTELAIVLELSFYNPSRPTALFASDSSSNSKWLLAIGTWSRPVLVFFVLLKPATP